MTDDRATINDYSANAWQLLQKSRSGGYGEN